MTTLKFATVEAPGDGVKTLWDFNFAGAEDTPGYLSKDHVKAYVTDIATQVRTDLTITQSMFTGPTTLEVLPAVPVGATLTIYRDTPKNRPLVNFTTTAILNESNLDEVARQSIYVSAEMVDQFLGAHEAAQSAAGSAVAAAASAVSAASSAASAAASFDGFDERYLGAKVGDPVLDNAGHPLQIGATYFNTTVDELRVYTATGWHATGAFGSRTPFVFNGTGAQTTFTLGINPGSVNATDVHVEGIYQPKSTYSVTSNSIVFSEAPPAGTANVEVVVVSSLPTGASDAATTTVIQSGAGAAPRTVEAELRETVKVRQFITTAVDGVTSNQTGIVAAVAEAMARSANLEWPAGTYVSDANIPNFHDVQHIGSGVLKRGSDTFVISGRAGSNKLYVSATGSDTNDGLSAAQPMLTLQKAADTWAKFAYVLRNAFTINLGAGTWTEGMMVDGVKSPAELVIAGASKATTIIDGTTAVNVMGLNFNNINNARVKNLTVRNWPGVGSGIIFQNGTRGVIDTCDGTNNAEANFNCSEDGEMVIVGVCTSTGSKQGMRYYRNSGGSVGDGTNAITITGATQSGLVVRDGSKVVTNNNFNVNACNSTATTTGVLVQKDGYCELRTCTITGNSIGVYAENNSIIDTQTGVRTVTGNTQNYRIRDGSFDRALFTFSADVAHTWIPNSNPTVQSPSSNYSLIVNYAGATGLQFLTDGNNVNLDFDKKGRISHVGSDNTLRFSMNNVDTFRMSTAAYFPVTDNARTLGLNANRWADVFAYNVTLKPPSTVTPANNGDLKFELTSDTQLKIKVKGSDGVVRAATLTLS